jgi:two-component system sensor histidine kinase CpxA
MQSLLLRIFLSFWLIIGITVGAASLGGFWYAERARSAFENFQQGDSLVEASAALADDGKAGLVRWLKEQPMNTTSLILVLDRDGRDILGRPVPAFVEGMLDRHRRHFRAGDLPRREPRNLRWARPLTQLVSPDGEIFTVVVAPPHALPFFWNSLPVRSLLPGLAIVVSALVSYLLARAITSPIRKLRDATVSLAEGNMYERVGSSLGARRDELGRLARDFDSMADKLQKSASLQTELTRNISHELRSPLSRMRVALELQRQKSGASTDLERIDTEIERLDRLIGQILSYSRLDSGERLTADNYDLAELIDEIVENVNYECRANGKDGVTVTAEIAQSVIVYGYRDAMNSAIENVLRNAARHSPRGATVNVRVDRKDTEKMLIEISDTGGGVADADLPFLFDAFFRTRETAASGAEQGTGLGLAIAARAVSRNAGKIVAANRPGGGLVVTITLPVRVGTAHS